MKARTRTDGGFTLAELMLVVASIGLLSSIAMPAFTQVRESSQNGAYICDLKIAKGAFIVYSIERGRYPADTTPGIMPNGMDEYLRGMKWAAPTPIGGQWDWDYRQFGCVAGVSVYQPRAPESQLIKLDKTIDDGNLQTGSFRSRSAGYISIME